MENNNKNNERVFAYQQAMELDEKELDKISGGSTNDNGLKITTKQTVDTSGSWDIGTDIIW